jgi:hypothetical protein
MACPLNGDTPCCKAFVPMEYGRVGKWYSVESKVAKLGVAAIT